MVQADHTLFHSVYVTNIHSNNCQSMNVCFTVPLISFLLSRGISIKLHVATRFHMHQTVMESDMPCVSISSLAG